jgi:hypothetical protein
MLKTPSSANLGLKSRQPVGPACHLIVEDDATLRYDIRRQLQAVDRLMLGKKCSGQRCHTSRTDTAFTMDCSTR